jgi:hypothetical protein
MSGPWPPGPPAGAADFFSGISQIIASVVRIRAHLLVAIGLQVHENLAGAKQSNTARNDALQGCDRSGVRFLLGAALVISQFAVLTHNLSAEGHRRLA